MGNEYDAAQTQHVVGRTVSLAFCIIMTAAFSCVFAYPESEKSALDRNCRKSR